MDNSGELVSVIVPIYKVEEYLRECIDSIIGQTYKNLEIILVDDGSPDRCGEICEEYARNDNRIKVYHKENGGLSDARNYGIERAHGEFLTFVDSDDVIKANFVEETLRLLHKYDADIVATPLMSFSGLIRWDNNDHIDEGEYCVSPHDILLEGLYQRMADVTTCAKLYRRETWEGVKFPKGMYFEDVVTFYRPIFKSRRTVFTKRIFYGYRHREGSITQERYSSRMLDSIPISKQMFNDITEKLPDLKTVASSRVFSLNRSVYLNFPFSRKKERMQVWAEMKKYRRAIIFDPLARKRERIAALLSYLGADLFHLLFSWLYRKQQLMK